MGMPRFVRVVLGAVGIRDVGDWAPSTLAARALYLVEGAVIIWCNNARNGKSTSTRICFVFEGFDAPGPRAPHPTTASAAGLFGACGILCNICAGAAHAICSILSAITAEAIGVFWCHVHILLATITVLFNFEIGCVACSAPFSLAAAACVFGRSAETVTDGNAFGECCATHVARIRGTHNAFGFTPGPTALAEAVALSGALALVGCNGHRIAGATGVFRVFSAEAASATFFLLPLILLQRLVDFADRLPHIIVATVFNGFRWVGHVNLHRVAFRLGRLRGLHTFLVGFGSAVRCHWRDLCSHGVADVGDVGVGNDRCHICVGCISCIGLRQIVLRDGALRLQATKLAQREAACLAFANVICRQWHFDVLRVCCRQDGADGHNHMQ
mmetsp:Transcript_63089/g.150726  ORF Transcript_63089/g.150726 Transcript_63089/m.150726 type:complete len:386 (-) Transcript_63089:68-1225(-)